MRLTVVLLLAVCLSQSFDVFAQQPAKKITLSVKNQRLENVFKEIKKQTGFTAFYKDEIAEKIKSVQVSLSVRNADIEEVIKRCLKDQPFSFRLIGNAIIITERNSADKEQPDETDPRMAVRGVVLNGRGDRMDNVNVIVKRSGKGAITDKNGEFNINDILADDILVCRMIGYTTVEVPVGGQPTIYIAMQEATSLLDQVVLQGYGKTSRRLSTGNINRISSKEIETQPVANPLLALQGRVPGLVITQTNGYASAPVNVSIRGVSSLTLNTEPLYIIDGVPISVTGPKGILYGNSFTGGQSPLFNINPKDIESIEVLKDADATAIYGSRGTNGVILISTKRGKPGPTNFHFNITQGIQKITRYWDMLNTPQYLNARREALKNDGIAPTTSNSPDLLLWDQHRYTNWQKALWGGTGRNTNISMGLSGGERQTTFRVNANYSRITDITAVSGATQQATMAFGLTHNTIDQKFSVNLSMIYAYSHVDVVNGTGNSTLAPNAPAIFDKDGNLNWAEWNADGLVALFPFGPMLQSNPQKTNSLSSSLSLGYRPFKGFSFNTVLGYTFNHNSNNFFNPIKSQNPYISPVGYASFNTNRITGWNIEPQANYHFLLGKASVDLLLGATLTSSSGIASAISGSGYTDDNLLYSIANAPVIDRPGDEYTYFKYAGTFARISYNLKNRYLVNLNGRRDGNSNFGPGRQFGDFGSVGVAWIASEEKWVSSALPSFISLVKLRGSYGTTGSAGGGPYQYLSLWGSSASLSEPYPSYDGVLPYIPQNPPNQDYHWEVNKKLEGALEVGLLDDDVTLSVSYYRYRTGNQITGYPLPDFTGFTSIITNLPATIQNSGWEGMVNAQLLNRKDMFWTVNFNISTNKNTLVSFPGLATSPYANRFETGKPLTARYFVHYLGVDPMTGRYALEDRDGNGVLTTSTAPGNPDAYIVLDAAPKYTGGFGTGYQYKRMHLTAQFSFRKQLGVNSLYMSGSYGQFNQNMPVEVYDQNWKKPGDISRYPVFSTTYHQSNADFGLSDGSFTDASFIRLTNLSVSWSLPEAWMKKIGVRDCGIGINAQNVFTITRYKGLDPETQNFGGMPPVKTYVLNLQLSL